MLITLSASTTMATEAAAIFEQNVVLAAGYLDACVRHASWLKRCMTLLYKVRAAVILLHAYITRLCQ